MKKRVCRCSVKLKQKASKNAFYNARAVVAFAFFCIIILDFINKIEYKIIYLKYIFGSK